MKILIISHELVSAIRVKNFLKEENLSADFKVFQNEEEILNFVSEQARNFRAIIFDRLNYDLLKIFVAAKESSCFFLIKNMDSVLLEEKIEGEIVLKFYFSPINYRLLTDDIKALALVKDYLHDELISLDKIALNLNTRVITNGCLEIFLRNKEFELLLYMARNKGRILSRINILENVWDMNSNLMTNTVDVHISRLRKILEKDFGVLSLIKTIPCSGYMLS